MHSPDPIGDDRCLIGHTGFVGSNLLSQARFARALNSATIGQLAQQRSAMIVCAAAPGSMFEANRNPEADRAKVHALIGHLDRARTERFVLISSIAVLADPGGGQDETVDAFESERAYGRHRRELEEFVERRFASHLIVRLPALYGEGLRKNFLFDLLNPVPTMLSPERLSEIEASLSPALADFLHALYAPQGVAGLMVIDRPKLSRDARRAALEQALIERGFDASQFHHRETTYQYYPIARLWSDITTALAAGLTHLHCATEPIAARDIHQHLTGRAMAKTPARLHREDMQTRHAALWGRGGAYLADRAEVLAGLARFCQAQRAPA